MRKKIKNILSNSFVQSVLLMVTGTIGAQVVKMVLSPIITRLYGPEAYGIMGVFSSIVQIIIPLAALTYPIAIVLPKDDRIAKGIVKLSIYISTVISLLTVFILLFFNNVIVKILNIENISMYLYFIPIILIFTVLMQVTEQWYIRTKQFGISARATFYQAVIIELGKLGFGFVNPVATVLVVFTVLSNGLKAFLLILFGRTLKRNKSAVDNKNISLLSIAKNYKDFPLLRAPQMLIDSITKSLPVLLLTSFFSPVVAGFYTICNMVLTLPSSLIGKAVGDVFYPKINEAALHKQEISNLIKKAILGLSGLAIIPFGLIILFGPWLFSFVFGDEWATAGEYARWLALSSFFRFINEPCIRSFPVLSAQSLHLILTIAQTIARIAGLWIGFYMFKDDKIAIALYGIIGALMNILLIILTLQKAKNYKVKSSI